MEFAHFIGSILAYCVCLWIAFKLMCTGNPLLAILGVLWLLGTLSEMFHSIISLIHVSFDWVKIFIDSTADKFGDAVKAVVK